MLSKLGGRAYCVEKIPPLADHLFDPDPDSDPDGYYCKAYFLKRGGSKMIPLIDFQNRSLNGPVMKPDDFDLEFAMKVREVVEKYDIKRFPEELVADESTGDAVFKAGVEVLAEVGLYHLNTQRVVRYTNVPDRWSATRRR